MEYHKTSSIRRTLVGNTFVHRSVIVWASFVGSNYIYILYSASYIVSQQYSFPFIFAVINETQ